MTNGGMEAVVRDLRALFEVGSLGGLSDEQLLGRFVARREGAVFEAIVQRHGPMVWGVCRRVLRDHHDAEDAFQATFLVLARKAASVVPRGKLGNWLYGVAHQTAMKARSMRAKRRMREGQVPDVPEPAFVPDEMRDDLAESLDRELSRLPEKYRIPVVLCDLEGMTHQEAASQLGWPVGTVSSRLSRARATLARRLSRPGMVLSGGSLALLLAQESASAGMPARLIGPTAQAASLIAAGGATTAGAVPAKVAALAGEVMKMMLLSKIKVATAMLLVVCALAAGGTSLTYRAHATEPANQKKDSEKIIEQSNPAEAVQEEVPPPEDQPNPAEAPKEDIRRPQDPGRVTGEETKPSSLLTENWQGSRQRKLERGAYSFTALRTGDAALAYNAATREVKAVRLHATKEQPLWVTPVAIESSSAQLVALGVQGERITRVALFNLKSGKWTPLDLDQPVNGCVSPMPFGPDTAAYEVGETLYLYNPKTDAWDRLSLRTIADDEQDAGATKGR